MCYEFLVKGGDKDFVLERVVGECRESGGILEELVDFVVEEGHIRKKNRVVLRFC